MNNKSVEQLMKERVSPRKFDTTYEVSDKDLDSIVEAIRMAPASYGILNTRVIVFRNGEFKDSLNESFYNQVNFIEASAYILFINDRAKKAHDVSMPKTADMIFGDDIERKERFLANFNFVWDHRMMAHGINSANEWSKQQGNIALGVAIVAAASLDIDVCPHGGFDQAKLEAILIEKKIIDKEEQVTVGLALGRIDPSVEKKAKIRMSKEEFRTDVK